ncbi:MAG: GDP-mannose 4,6-dehydratase [Candidatus Rifleibacteriota bacterium]
MKSHEILLFRGDSGKLAVRTNQWMGSTPLQTPQKTVLITGVTGFAGSYLADYLLNRGYRVIGSLEVDSRAFCRELGWQPPVSMIEQFMEMAEENR